LSVAAASASRSDPFAAPPSMPSVALSDSPALSDSAASPASPAFPVSPLHLPGHGGWYAVSVTAVPWAVTLGRKTKERRNPGYASSWSASSIRTAARSRACADDSSTGSPEDVTALMATPPPSSRQMLTSSISCTAWAIRSGVRTAVQGPNRVAAGGSTRTKDSLASANAPGDVDGLRDGRRGLLRRNRRNRSAYHMTGRSRPMERRRAMGVPTVPDTRTPGTTDRS
jgi:hypothetical protein